MASVTLLAILFGTTSMVQAQLTAADEERQGRGVPPGITPVVSSNHLFHSKPYSIVSYILLIMYPFVKG